MSKKLTIEVLDDAIDELKQRLWRGAELNSSLIASVAEDYEMRAEALAANFERRYPLGDIGQKPLTASEQAAADARTAATKALQEYGKWTKVDGREVLLDGVLHTLVTENSSRRVVIAFRHEDLKVVEIKTSKFTSMRKSRP